VIAEMVERFRPSGTAADQWPATGARGEIEAGTYDGPEAHQHLPWKCPRCAAENVGPIAEGCSSCGSGSAKAYHVETPLPPATIPPPFAPTRNKTLRQLREDMERGLAAHDAALAWTTANPTATALQAFLAGYATAKAEVQRAAAAALTIPETSLFRPEAKLARTMAVALRHFLDTVLRQSPEAIESGEWLSIPEVEALIREYEEQT
jgi:hypothetical protein